MSVSIEVLTCRNVERSCDELATYPGYFSNYDVALCDVRNRSQRFFEKKCCNYHLQPSEFNAYLSSAIEIVFVFLEISLVFMIKSSFIQITLVFPGFLLRLVKIITNTVRFQEALHFAQMFIHDVNGSYSVIL